MAVQDVIKKVIKQAKVMEKAAAAIKAEKGKEGMFKCPVCRNSISEVGFYCPNCLTQLQY